MFINSNSKNISSLQSQTINMQYKRLVRLAMLVRTSEWDSVCLSRPHNTYNKVIELCLYWRYFALSQGCQIDTSRACEHQYSETGRSCGDVIAKVTESLRLSIELGQQLRNSANELIERV